MKNNNPKKKSVIIIVHCTWYLYNFRIKLLEELSKKGYELILLSPYDKYYKKIKKYFSKSRKLFLFRGSENIFLEMITIFHLFYFYLKFKPILIHNFSIKPSIYGGLLARIFRVKYVINHITGLGPSFFSNRIKIRIFNLLFNPIYKYSFNNPRALNVFHNNSDRYTFINKNFTLIKNTNLIMGSGVDIDYFKNRTKKNIFAKTPQILFPARIIKEKGIIELVQACNELIMEDYNFVLNIAGEIDKKNNSCLNNQTLNELKDNTNINFIGKSQNMFEIYQNVDMVVLPSWREGLSMSILEAASMSLPIITTDVPGCRDIIKDGYSGLLVSPKDKDQLKNAIEIFLNNPKKAINYGIKARKTIEKNFTYQKINSEILKIYDQYLN